MRADTQPIGGDMGVIEGLHILVILVLVAILMRKNSKINELRTRVGVIDELRREVEHWKQCALAHPVTGMLNVRGLLLEYARISAHLKRDGKNPAFGCLFIDLDGFKRVNDTQGHDVGDRILCEVARALEGCIRAYDIAVHKGGDEFLLLLETNEGITREQLLARVDTALAPVLTQFAGVGYTAGYTTTHASEEIEDAIKRADHDMNAQKVAQEKRSR